MKRLTDEGGVMSWAEVGRRCGMSATNARKIGNRAIEKLRCEIKARGIRLDDMIIGESRLTPDHRLLLQVMRAAPLPDEVDDES